MENLDILVKKLCQLPTETNWLEFKHNNFDPDMIGADISALANSAAFFEKSYAYMIWGIDNTTHKIVGTELDQYKLKKGNQEIDNWLRSLLSNNADFEFHTTMVENKKVVILIIYRAVNKTVMFKKIDYIRIGSYTKKLCDYPNIQAQLWDKLRSSNFEDQVIKKDLSLEQALQYLDYTVYFDLIGIPQPSDAQSIMHYMLEEDIIIQQDNGLFGITNMGAILFAKHLSDFPHVSRKAIRVVRYRDNNRYSTLKEYNGNKGYVVGFKGLINFIDALIPTEETVGHALREKKSAYPSIAIREAVANALIHQDLTISGTGPIIEIFDSRIEITNPGTPLVDIMRIIDNPPRSRNEKIASLMRRLKICEELGTGWDKIALSCEWLQLPAPKIVLYEENTRVMLFAKTDYSNISNEDRLWACYLHACVKYVQNEQVTNTSLRNRFGLKESSSGSVSRLIKEAVKHKLLKPLDPHTAPRYMKYIPYWA